MTRKLEQLFDMIEDPVEKDLEEPILPQDEEQDTPVISQGTLAAIEKVENALPQVRGLDSSDAELDELSALAKEAFNNLMDLGMQCEARFSAEIFNSASSMLGHAITTKTAKVNKKLKMIDLQLKQAELHRKLSTTAAKPAHPTDEKLPLGTGSVLNRDELIKMILSQTSTDAINSDKKDK